LSAKPLDKTEKDPETVKDPDEMMVDVSKWQTIIKFLKEFSKPLFSLRRAMQGLPEDETLFTGFMNIKDTRERTRVTEPQIVSHSFLRLMSSFFPETLGNWKEIAEMEDVYYIALDGEQRKEAILSQKARNTVNVQGVEGALQIPKVETKPSEPQKRKGLFRRG